MNFTDNGSELLTMERGKSYVFSAQGTFGGGSVALQWSNDGGSTWTTESSLSSADSVIYYSPSNLARVAVSGATSPDLTVQVDLRDSFLPVSTKEITDAGTTGKAVLAAGTAGAANNVLWEAKTGAFTAVSGGRYVCIGTFTVTNPATGNDGEMFTVVAASGTVTVNGTAYGVGLWPITVARVAGTWTTLPNTLTDNLTLNGTANTAPNQTAASGASLMTRDLVDSRVFLGNPLSLGSFWELSPAMGATTVAGSGSGTVSVNNFRLSTGSTSGSSALWRANTSAVIRFAKNGSAAGVQYTRPVWLCWTGQLDLRTDGVFRIQLGRLFSATTIADFSPNAITQGFGFYLNNGQVNVETCNATTRSLSSSLGSYSTSGAFFIDLKARSDGTGNVRVWINGSEVSTVTGGPTGDNNSTGCGTHISVENVAASASYLADMAKNQFFVVVE